MINLTQDAKSVIFKDNAGVVLKSIEKGTYSIAKVENNPIIGVRLSSLKGYGTLFLEISNVTFDGVAPTTIEELEQKCRSFFFSVGGSGGGGGNYKGGWNPKTNTPDIYTTAKDFDDFVVVEDLEEDEVFAFDFGAKGGIISLTNNDRVVFNGSNYVKQEYLVPDASEIQMNRDDASKGSVLEAINSSQSGLQAEITARQNADITLQNNITAEATARANADTAINSAITAINNNALQIKAVTPNDLNNATQIGAYLLQPVTNYANKPEGYTVSNGGFLTVTQGGTNGVSQLLLENASNILFLRTKHPVTGIWSQWVELNYAQIVGLQLDVSNIQQWQSEFENIVAYRNTAVLKYIPNVNYLYETGNFIADPLTGEGAIVMQNFNGGAKFMDLVNNGTIQILPIGSRTPLPILDSPDQNTNYNNEHGYATGSEIEYQGDVWIYLEEDTNGVPAWVLKENAEIFGRSFELIGEYADGTIITVSNAIGLPDADYTSTNNSLFTSSFKANYIIDSNQPLFNILDLNGNVVNSLPLRYLSSAENPIKNDGDLPLEVPRGTNGEIITQADLNSYLYERGDIISYKGKTSFNPTINIVSPNIAVTGTYTRLANRATIGIIVTFSGTLNNNSVFEFDLSSLGTCSDISGIAYYSDDSKARPQEGIVVPSVASKFNLASEKSYWSNSHPVTGVSNNDAIYINLTCQVAEWSETSPQFTKGLIAGTGIQITESATDRTISATSQGNIQDQGLKIVSINGSDSTGNGTYANPYKTVNKALEIVKWNGIVEVQPSSGGSTHSLSQIIIPPDTSNPSVIHWNLTLTGSRSATNANRTELTFDSTTSNFISIPNSNVRFNLINVNLDFNANKDKPLVVGGGGAMAFQNLTFKNHATPLIFDLSSYTNANAYLYLRDLSLDGFPGNLKFRNIPVGVSNITVYIQGQNTTNLSIDTTQINAINPTATLTIIYDKEILIGQSSAQLTPTTIILTNEIKDIYGFIANSSALLTQNFTGLYVLSANIASVGSRGDIVYIIKKGTNTSILGGLVRSYAQCPNTFFNPFTNTFYVKDAGYWATKQNSLTIGTSSQYLRADLINQTLDYNAGLLSVLPNTALATPVSANTFTAFYSKADGNIWVKNNLGVENKLVFATNLPSTQYNVSDTLNTPPSSPIDGETYLVGTSPTGAYAGKANNVAVYSTSTNTWYFIAPSTSIAVIFTGGANVGKVGTWNGTAWVVQTATSDSVPVGTVMSFYGNTAPTGFLFLDGNTIVSGKTVYSGLWTFAQTNNITTTNILLPQLFISLNANDFKIPDFRGYFLRGLGGIDPSATTRTLGSVQQDEFRSHNHLYYYPIYGVDGINPALTNTNYVNQPNNNGTTANSGGAETRPVNIAIKYIIKF